MTTGLKSGFSLRHDGPHAGNARIPTAGEADRGRRRDRPICRNRRRALAVVGVCCLIFHAWAVSLVEGLSWKITALAGIVGWLVGYFVGKARK